MKARIFERESTGGAVARMGFEYQDFFVLQHLPEWIAQGGFSHVVSEALGDVEVCYFAARGGTQRVFYEMKDGTLTSTQFWDEVERFRVVDATSPECVRFVLVCRNFNSATSPLVAKLDRLRGVGTSYDADSPVLTDGRRDIIDWMVQHGQAGEAAEFVLDKVEFMTYASEHADAAFAGMFADHFPALELLPRAVSLLRDKFKRLITRSSTGPIPRRDLETAVVEVSGDAGAAWLATLTVVLLSLSSISPLELGLSVSRYNGPERGKLPPVEWKILEAAAAEIERFIKDSRPRRSVRLDGKQRMSVACLIGHAFSATRGFVLDVEHNGAIYHTGNHALAAGHFYAMYEDAELGGGSEGVACLSFPTPIGGDVELLRNGELTECPRLTLHSGRTVGDLGALNLAVAEAKEALVSFRSKHKLSRVHLVLKTPSVFAMVLGHRLNGVGAVQLYDWVDGQYVPTAEMLPS